MVLSMFQSTPSLSNTGEKLLLLFRNGENLPGHLMVMGRATHFSFYLPSPVSLSATPMMKPGPQPLRIQTLQAACPYVPQNIYQTMWDVAEMGQAFLSRHVSSQGESKLTLMLEIRSHRPSGEKGNEAKGGKSR